MDWGLFGTIIGAAVATIGAIYTFLRHFKDDIRKDMESFKTDINGHIDRLEKRMDKLDKRADQMDEKIFFLATGKTLEQAILEKKVAEQK